MIGLTGQEVISLLRDQLATKTGEIVEARDRISLLEQGQAAQAHAILEIEQVRKESGAREAEILRKRDEAEKRLDDVLVKGREREETLEEELKAVKKGVEDQKASNSSLEATNATLVASCARPLLAELAPFAHQSPPTATLDSSRRVKSTKRLSRAFN